MGVTAAEKAMLVAAWLLIAQRERDIKFPILWMRAFRSALDAMPRA